MNKINHENAPHVLTALITVRVNEMKNTGELVPVTKNKDIKIFKRFNNLEEAKILEKQIIEELHEKAKEFLKQ